jgi:hypothetical protein
MNEDKVESYHPDPKAHEKRAPPSVLASRDENTVSNESRNQNSQLFFHESYILFTPSHANCSMTESMNGNSQKIGPGTCPVSREWWVLKC